MPGDLIIHQSKVPTRLNPSFGAVTYADNDRYGNYQGIYFQLKGRFSRGFIDASYTRSRSQDDALAYPTPFNPGQYYGPSNFDVPNRFSLSFNYQLKGLNDGRGAVGYLTGGWGISGTSAFQSGYPITVANSNSYQPVCQDTSTNAPPCPSLANPAVGYAAGSGDYNADGSTQNAGLGLDYPDVSSYHQGTSKSAFLNGIFSAGQFAAPTFGSEGNERSNRFRGPNFAETNVNFYKDNRITERVNLQLRFEFFNIFNRANLANVNVNLPDGNFGKATRAHLPRWWQVGGKISF